MLVVGATGSIGRLVVAEAIRQGHNARWSATQQGGQLPADAEMVIGDLTRPETLPAR